MKNGFLDTTHRRPTPSPSHQSPVATMGRSPTNQNRIVILLIAGLAFAVTAQAQTWFQNTNGLANPASTITFSEILLTTGTVLTTQYSGFGVTFSGVYYSPSTSGEPSHVDNANIGNFKPNVAATNPFYIYFNGPVTQAAIALGGTYTGTTTFTAYLRGVNVGSFSASSGPLTNDFYGLTGVTFDEIQISVSSLDSAALMDNLQFTSAINSWIGTVSSGKWEVATNWSLGRAPSSLDSMDSITNATSKTVTINATTTNTASNLIISNSNLSVSAPLGSTNTLFLNDAGTLSVPLLVGSLTVGSGGTITVTNSTLEVDSAGFAGGIEIDGVVVGYSGNNNQLVITNGGAVSSVEADLGLNPNSSNNTVLVSGTGSVWSISSSLFVGASGTSNQLTIADGGTVFSGDGILGNNFLLGDNVVLVSGTGSVWSSTEEIVVGGGSPGNLLSITNGGAVYSLDGVLGSSTGSSNNTVLVTGSGSVWSNLEVLTIGFDGVANQLIITKGGAVYDLDADLGFNLDSSNNTVLVSDLGSVWNNSNGLEVGSSAPNNRLTIANGGAVYCDGTTVGQGSSSNNVVLVSGHGSVWSNTVGLSVGQGGVANQVIITNGGAVFSEDGYVGDNGRNNTVLVTGSGSVWSVQVLSVGNGTGSASNTLTIADDGVVNGNGFVIGGLPDLAAFDGFASNNLVQVNGGSLVVTNAGNGQLVVSQVGGKGSLILNGGTVTVDQLVLTNGLNSLFTFNSGTLTSGGTFVTNNQSFVVGDGIDAATFQLNGGVHNFFNNLVIQNNATLSGCGAVNGNVVVDPGGNLLADCGQTLTFTGSVTNYGTMLIDNGSTLTTDGLVVNYGGIEVIDGSTNFLGGFINYGSVSTNENASHELFVTNAFDSADDGSYGTLPDHTYSTTNGGYGYDLWTTNSGTSGGGTYMEGPGVNARGVPNTNDFSFALYAGGSGSAGPGNTGSGFTLSRPLAIPLAVGELRFYSRFDLDAGNGQFNGFGLRAANNTNSFGSGQLLAFGLGGTAATSNQLTFTDAAGFHIIPSSVEARGSVWFWVVDFNAAAGTYALVVTNMSSTFSFTTSGNLIANGTTVGSLAAINQSSGNNQNLIFDQLTFTNTTPVAVARITISGTTVVLEVPSAYGFTYQLQVNTSLAPTNWTDVGTSQAGNGDLLSFTEPGGTTNSSARFYRIEVTTP
jgi:T5SS/PEP-CTERM-associated repeat protein